MYVCVTSGAGKMNFVEHVEREKKIFSEASACSVIYFYAQGRLHARARGFGYWFDFLFFLKERCFSIIVRSVGFSLF